MDGSDEEFSMRREEPIGIGPRAPFFGGRSEVFWVVRASSVSKKRRRGAAMPPKLSSPRSTALAKQNWEVNIADKGICALYSFWFVQNYGELTRGELDVRSTDINFACVP